MHIDINVKFEGSNDQQILSGVSQLLEAINTLSAKFDDLTFTSQQAKQIKDQLDENNQELTNLSQTTVGE